MQQPLPLDLIECKALESMMSDLSPIMVSVFNLRLRFLSERGLFRSTWLLIGYIRRFMWILRSETWSSWNRGYYRFKVEHSTQFCSSTAFQAATLHKFGKTQCNRDCLSLTLLAPSLDGGHSIKLVVQQPILHQTGRMLMYTLVYQQRSPMLVQSAS